MKMDKKWKYLVIGGLVLGALILVLKGNDNYLSFLFAAILIFWLDWWDS